MFFLIFFLKKTSSVQVFSDFCKPGGNCSAEEESNGTDVQGQRFDMFDGGNQDVEVVSFHLEFRHT